MTRFPIRLAIMVLACAAAGCASKPKNTTPPEPPWHPPTTMLLPYASPDGSLTRAQLEAGLHRDFDRLDPGHSGCLTENQVRTINAERWKQDASTASPLIDFKHNGCIDFGEYAATPRSLFEMLDRKGDGKLPPQVLKPGKAKPGTPAAQPAAGATLPAGGGTGH
jgi:hypothetical protein